MTKRNIRVAVAATLAACIAMGGVAFAQFGGGGARWQTDAFNAERSGAAPADMALTPQNLQSGVVKMVWKKTIPNARRQLDAITQPSFSGPGNIMYDGFKYWAYYADASGYVAQTDYQVGFDGKTRQIGAASTAGTLTCSGAVTATTQPVAPPTDINAAAAAGGAAAGRGGRGGGGAPPAGAAGPTPLPPRVSDLQSSMRPTPVLPDYQRPKTEFNGNISLALWAVNGSGKAYALNNQTLEDLFAPIQFLPAGANVAGLMAITAPGGGGGGRGGGGGGGAGGGFAGGGAPAAATPANPLDRSLLAATTNSCGGAANGLWKLQVPESSSARPVTSWSSQGANIAGADGFALGSLGGTNYAAYLATSDGSGSYVNSVVAVDPATMTLKGQYKASAPFTSSPLTFAMGGKSVVAAMNKDGKLYLLDGANLATPLATSVAITSGKGDYVSGALASWADSAGQRWIAVPVAGSVNGVTAGNGAVTNGALVAFKVMQNGSSYSLQPGWVSPDLTSPSAPAIEGSVVFVTSTGLATSGATAAARIAASKGGVLYALDAATGKPLWNSGSAITGPTAKVGPSVASSGFTWGSSVMVSGLDGTLYAFGAPTIR